LQILFSSFFESAFVICR